MAIHTAARVATRLNDAHLYPTTRRTPSSLTTDTATSNSKAGNTK